MAKHKIEILGKEYPSIASAANYLHVSKFALHKLFQSDQIISQEKLNELKQSFGKKKYSKRIKVGEQEYDSINSAAKANNIDPGALHKALEGKSQITQGSIRILQERKKGYHRRAVVINGLSFPTLSDAAEHFGCHRNKISRLIDQGKDFVREEEDLVQRVIVINEMTFPTLTAAAEHFGCSRSTIKKRLKGYIPPKKMEIVLNQRTFPTLTAAAKYFECSTDKIKRLVEQGKDFTKKEIVLDQMTFPTRDAAAKYFGCSLSTIKKRLAREAVVPPGKEIIVNGIKFSTIGNAAKHFRIAASKISSSLEENGFAPINLEIKRTQTKTRKFNINQLREMAEACGLVELEDWYTKSRKGLAGYGLLATKIREFWNADIFCALSELFPDKEVEWWRFNKIPNGVFEDQSKRKQYVDWLHTELQYKSLNDWYNVTYLDFEKNGGNTLVNYMGDIGRLLADLYPTEDWKPWKFKQIPRGSWRSKKLQRDYMLWLADILKIKSHEDWYKQNLTDVLKQNYGVTLKKQFKNQLDLFTTIFPEHKWEFWRFQKIRGVWGNIDKQKEYLNWLAKQLGIGHPADWYNVTEQDFSDNHGLTLLGYYGASVSDCIMTVLQDDFRW